MPLHYVQTNKPDVSIAEGTKPKLISVMKDVKVTSPKTATLSCEIEPGEPRATVRWYKDEKEV